MGNLKWEQGGSGMAECGKVRIGGNGNGGSRNEGN